MNLVTIDELSYNPTDALDMKLSGDCKTLREELIARAADGVEMPEEARGIWFGEIQLLEGSFVVTLYYNKDAVEYEEKVTPND
jgi:hypothetical protein